LVGIEAAESFAESWLGMKMLNMHMIGSLRKSSVNLLKF